MDEKVQFISLVLEGSLSTAEACRTFGISRKTGYKWLNRYSSGGAGGLNELQRGPKILASGSRNPSFSKIIKVRGDHPAWGAPKIRAFLHNQGFKKLPSVSTCGRILQRNGLIKRKDPSDSIRFKVPLSEAKSPNDIWTVDYKGDFVLSDKIRCYPLTISDRFSRYLLCCDGFQRTTFKEAQESFQKTFKKYGLPSVIRSDNGVPFSAANGLSRLAVWWIDLGITPEVIDPGKPYQNGQHERMHRVLKEEAIDTRLSFAKQSERLRSYIRTYNDLRPHQGLSNQVPSDVYKKSAKKYSDKITPWSYEGKTVKVDHRGNIYFKGQKQFISHALDQKYVGVDEVDTDLWLVNYRDFPLKYLDLGIAKS